MASYLFGWAGALWGGVNAFSAAAAAAAGQLPHQEVVDEAPAAQLAGAELDDFKKKVLRQVTEDFIKDRYWDGSAAYEARHQPRVVPSQGVGAVAGPAADAAATAGSSGLEQTAVAPASTEAAATAAETAELTVAAPAATAVTAAARFNLHQFLAEVVGKRNLALMVASQQLLTLPTADLAVQHMSLPVAPSAMGAFSLGGYRFFRPAVIMFDAPLSFGFPAVFDLGVSLLFRPVAVPGFGWGGPVLPGWTPEGGYVWGGPLVLAPAATATMVAPGCFDQLAALLSAATAAAGVDPHRLAAALGVRMRRLSGSAAPPQLLLIAQVSVIETGLQMRVALFAAPTAAEAPAAAATMWSSVAWPPHAAAALPVLSATAQRAPLLLAAAGPPAAQQAPALAAPAALPEPAAQQAAALGSLWTGAFLRRLRRRAGPAWGLRLDELLLAASLSDLRPYCHSSFLLASLRAAAAAAAAAAGGKAGKTCAIMGTPSTLFKRSEREALLVAPAGYDSSSTVVPAAAASGSLGSSERAARVPTANRGIWRSGRSGHRAYRGSSQETTRSNSWPAGRSNSRMAAHLTTEDLHQPEPSCPVLAHSYCKVRTFSSGHMCPSSSSSDAPAQQSQAFNNVLSSGTFGSCNCPVHTCSSHNCVLVHSSASYDNVKASMDAHEEAWYRRMYLAATTETGADASSSSSSGGGGGNPASAAGTQQGTQVDSMSPVAATAGSQEVLPAGTPNQGAAVKQLRLLLPAETMSGTEPAGFGDAAAASAGFGDHHHDASPASGLLCCSNCKAGSATANSTGSGDEEDAADEADDVCGHGRAEPDSPAGYSTAAYSPTAYSPASFYGLSPLAAYGSAGHSPMLSLQGDDAAVLPDPEFVEGPALHNMLGQSTAAAAGGVAYDSAPGSVMSSMEGPDLTLLIAAAATNAADAADIAADADAVLKPCTAGNQQLPATGPGDVAGKTELLSQQGWQAAAAAAVGAAAAQDMAAAAAAAAAAGHAATEAGPAETAAANEAAMLPEPAPSAQATPLERVAALSQAGAVARAGVTGQAAGELGGRVDLAAALGDAVAHAAQERSARVAQAATEDCAMPAMVAPTAGEARAAVEGTEVAVSIAAEAGTKADAAAEACTAAQAPVEAEVSLQLLLEIWGSFECPTTGCSTYKVVDAGLELSCCEEGKAVMQQQTHCCMHRVRACLEVTAG